MGEKKDIILKPSSVVSQKTRVMREEGRRERGIWKDGWR